MKRLFKAMAVIGAVLALGAAGTDFYLSELGQSLPFYVSAQLLIGIALMIPALLMKEGE